MNKSILFYLRTMLEDYAKGDMEKISELYIKYQNMYDGIDDEDAHSALEILQFIVIKEFELNHPDKDFDDCDIDEVFEMAMIINGHHQIWVD